MTRPNQSLHRLSATGVVGAPPERVWEVLTDYRDEHDRILPRPPFVSMTVLEGGRGAGTVIRLEMRLLGRTRSTRGVVTEPEPGRLLMESYPDDRMVTTFALEPGPWPGTTGLTIATEVPARGGIAGALEGWIVTRLLRPVYLRELAQLDAHVRRYPQAPARPEGIRFEELTDYSLSNERVAELLGA